MKGASGGIWGYLGMFFSTSGGRLLDFEMFGLVRLDGFGAAMYVTKACWSGTGSSACCLLNIQFL